MAPRPDSQVDFSTHNVGESANVSASTSTCRSHGIEKTKYGHWLICPLCEPEFHNAIYPPVATPKPELLDKGIPARR